MGTGIRGRMKTKDKGRKWMWWFLGVLGVFQLYFVRELVAAFALFAIGFAAVAMLVASVFMLHKVWEAGLVRVAQNSGPVVSVARRGFAFAEELSKRPFRRPGSQPAQ